MKGYPEGDVSRCRFLLEGLGQLQHRLEAHGSGLHFVLGRSEEAVVTALRALAPAAGRVDLHHQLGIGGRAAREEAAVQEAFLACAQELGVPCEVHRAWGGHTLFHPEDALPALDAARSKRGGKRTVQTASSAAEPVAAGSAAFQGVPPIMTDFRKARRLCHTAAQLITPLHGSYGILDAFSPP